MARLNDTHDQQRAPAQANCPPDAAGMLVEQLLIPWTRRHGALPAPCARDLNDCARWWLNKMQEPEQPGETYHAAAVGGGLRWETGYANRCRSALFAFLGLTDPERQSVVNIVTRDAIPYRGEPFRQFIELAEETEAMRADPDLYKRNTMERLNRVFAAGVTGRQRALRKPSPVA